jgi:hypothetical protein
MPRWPRSDDDWDDDGVDYGPIDQDLEAEEADDLCYPCPYCGRDVLEESERCPYCEHYISKEDAPHERKPIWIWLGVAACLYVVYRWITLKS